MRKLRRIWLRIAWLIGGLAIAGCAPDQPQRPVAAFDHFMQLPAADLLAEYERLATNPTDEMTVTPDGNVNAEQFAVLLAVLCRREEIESEAK